ncbi:MAG TPA: hypothetical protein ENI05_11525 [Porticoccus sp.]|nr:hypothetical protein [Porticoccus sp.]
MKKLVTILLLVIVCGITAAPPPPPGDVVINFTIPAAKVDDFKAGFLAKAPIPLIESSESTPELRIMVPQYTAKQWIKAWQNIACTTDSDN